MLKIDDLDLKVRAPKLPRSMKVFELSAPTLEERRPGIDRLREELRLGDLRPVELEHGLVLAGKRGEIEFFHASGSVWARDAAAAQGGENELRRWADLHESQNGRGRRFSLGPETVRKLVAKARRMLDATGLVGGEVVSETVDLDQVARLDEKGREVERGAGQATVKLLYAVDGVPVRGAGAKTLLFADPQNGEGRIVGGFHAWRTLGEARPVDVPALDEALSVGLLTDPELVAYRTAGHRIRITRLDLAYLALPAFMRQSHLFPAFQVEGEVLKGKRGPGFRFARYHHAVPPKAYAAADLFGPYLSVNPDGIAAPAPQRRR